MLKINFNTLINSWSIGFYKAMYSHHSFYEAGLSHHTYCCFLSIHVFIKEKCIHVFMIEKCIRCSLRKMNIWVHFLFMNTCMHFPFMNTWMHFPFTNNRSNSNYLQFLDFYLKNGQSEPIRVLYKSYYRFLLAVESCDLSS